MSRVLQSWPFSDVDPMRYDPWLRAAVFLGPSLDRTTAERILPANYYPPVRMGDIYRLVATGVRVIVIIDGVFHWVTPVWQREIRAALESGITVIGAASMGALRAAELAPFGMIGCGTIWGWYRDGLLDGDDEVALLHGDETMGYRAISEPLVNIRYNVSRAVERRLLSERDAQQLIDTSKQRYFGDRSYRTMLEDAGTLDMSAPQLRDLGSFIADEAVNLKRTDALEALTHCAELLASVDLASPRVPVRRARAEDDGGFSALALLKRGVRRADGELVPMESLVPRIAADDEEMRHLQRRASVRFLLSRWATDHRVTVPEQFRQRFRQAWIADHIQGDLPDWLPTVGLTRPEFDDAIDERATIEWLLESGPESYALEFGPHRRCIDWLSSGDAGRQISDDNLATSSATAQRAVLLRGAAEACYVASWARERGIACPDQVASDAIAQWEAKWGISSRARILESARLDESQYLSILSQRACYHWAADHGPNYFGYPTFSFAQALLTEQQVTGGVAGLVVQGAAP